MQKPPGLAPKLARQREKTLWRQLLSRLEALERDWADATRRQHALEQARSFASGLESAGIGLPPGLRELARRLAGSLERHELASLVVPLERALDRRVQDEDFLPTTDRSEPRAATMPVCVVADSLRSAFNVGGVFRTAECFGAEEILLSGYSAGPDDARVARAAMGTDRRVAWRRHRSVADAAQALRERGCFAIALETAEEHPPLAALELRFPCAILLGNERFGLSPSVVADADARARIPTCGAKASLNVVSALAIALYELRRRFEAAGEGTGDAGGHRTPAQSSTTRRSRSSATHRIGILPSPLATSFTSRS
jgi:23S rRNA (guanosine2251-2'-O)-methyltransferase